VYNIGTQKERTVMDVARDVCHLFDLNHEEALLHVRDRAFNDKRYFICDKKLLSLGWKEETPWEEGLQLTVDWYLKHGFAEYWDNGERN
jgi:dTDP-D-glucose 4,6-dehydratase